MKNKTRKLKSVRSLLLIVIILTICILTGCSTSAESENNYDLTVVEPTDDFYVNDFANLFNETQKEDLMTKAVNMDIEYGGIQVVITTVESFEKTVTDFNGEKPSLLTVEQISYSMYKQYGIGKEDMGILILFSVGDREVRIETGWKMQNYFTDSLSGQILDDYGMPYFTEDDFAEGLISVQAAVIEEIQNRVPIDWNETESTEVEENTSTEANNAIVSETEVLEETNKDIDSNNNTLVKIFSGIVAGIIGLFVLIGTFVKRKFSNIIKSEQKRREELLARKDDECDEKLLGAKYAFEKRIADMSNEAVRRERAKNSEISSLKRQLEKANVRIGNLSEELSILQDKYLRIQTLHPESNFDKEVEEMIESEYQTAAIDIDKQLLELMSMSADKDNISFFAGGIDLYEQTIPQVQKYLTVDIEKLRELHRVSISMKKEFDRIQKEKYDKDVAKRFYDSLHIMLLSINQVGDYQTYERLNEMCREYEKLSQEQKDFIPDKNQVQLLKKLYKTAKSDNEDFCMAKETEQSIESIVSRIYSADEDDVDELERAMREYNALSSRQKNYFSAELLRKLKSLLEDAEEDQRRQEMRRRERREQQSRMNSYSSSNYNRSSSYNRPSSTSHRSSFGGHGGRPGAGGASRKF